MKYSLSENTLPEGRAQLTQVIREAGDVITIDSAAQTLNVSRTITAKHLARWTKQGWLRRVSHGHYMAASLDSLASEHVLDDPWILVPALYEPSYVGGWTAAEHWDLTEQIFKSIVVLTARTIRNKTQRHHSADFSVKHIQKDKIFGTKPIWRRHTKVMISDVHRTIIDMLEDPTIGGGIQHVSDCLADYFKRPDRDDGKLVEYADRLKNGAIFKRLGFLIESMPQTDKLLSECLNRLTKGNAKLDPSHECQRLISRWHLWVPNTFKHV